jgi:hypothetical protein
MKTLILHNRHYGFWPLADFDKTVFPVFITGKYRKFIVQSLHVRLRGEHENPPDLVISVVSDRAEAMVSYLDDVQYWGVNFDIDLSTTFRGTQLTQVSTVIEDRFGDDIGQMSEVSVDIVATHWFGFGTDVVSNQFAGQGSPVAKFNKKHKHGQW